MDDLISRQQAIKDAESWVAVDEYEKHLQKNVVEWLKEFPSAEHGMNLAEVGKDLISRQAAIDALWKALFDYEDKTEKQFRESEELDVGDWIGHRIFVQDMSDIDRQVILSLPSAEPQIIRCRECAYWDGGICNCAEISVSCPDYMVGDLETDANDFCSHAERRTG